MCNCNETRKLTIEFDNNLLNDNDFEISVRKITGTPRLAGCAEGVNVVSKTGETYCGERRDLTTLLGCRNLSTMSEQRPAWVTTFFAIEKLAREGMADIIKAGDYFKIPIKAKAGKHGDLDFGSLDIPETEIVVTQVRKDRIVINFEDVLFHSAVNKEDTNHGGFKNSALSEYLNAEFLDAFDPVKVVLAENVDGKKVSLPTFYEVMGDDDFGSDVNWEEEPCQLEYFNLIKNRIRIKDNETYWWWLSTESRSPSFCIVTNYGNPNTHYASNSGGGVAPAFCVRGTRKI